MSDPANALYDGNHETPFLCKPPLPWIDAETRANMLQLTYRVRVPFYKRFPRSARNALARFSYLVEQPKPRPVGGDLLEYDLVFSTLPVRPDEPLPWVMNYQVITAGGTEIAEIAVPLTARASWKYYYTSEPFKIQLKKAWKAVLIGGAILYTGTKPKDGATTWLAEDESFERWKDSDIWAVRTVTVPSPETVTLTS